MKRLQLLLLGLFLCGATSCESPQEAPRQYNPGEKHDGSIPHPPPAEPGTLYSFVFLESGPAASELNEEQIREASLGHRANIKRLGEEDVLLLAGPFGEPRLADNHRGIFIFDVEKIEEARNLTASDPAVKVGAFSMSATPWISTAPLRELHEAKRARQERGEAFAGKAYVMGIGSPAFMATEAIEALRSAGKLVFAGEFQAERKDELLFVLTTDSVDEAREWLTNMPGGADVDWNLSSWYATDLLMTMVE